MAARRTGACCWVLAVATGTAWGASGPAPAGCQRGLNPLYFVLCSLREAWGIVLEALAGAGLLAVGLLTLALLACGVRGRRTTAGALLGLRLLLAAGAWGLLGLVFAFVVRPHPANCAARRFLFGTLFALCFASLAAQAGALAWRATPGRAALLSALGLFLLECLINAEWLIATATRGRPLSREPGQSPCAIAKKDFVASLVYVMALLAGGLALSVAAVLRARRTASRRRAAYLLAASCLSAAVWVAWVVVYFSGDRRTDWRSMGEWGSSRDAWDDPPLALALLVSGWLFALCCLVPWLLEMRRGQGEELGEDEEDRSSEGEEGIRLEKANPSRAYVDNKAFSLDDGLGKRYPSPYQDVKPSATVKLETNQDPRASTGSGARDIFHLAWPQTPMYRTHFA